MVPRAGIVTDYGLEGKGVGFRFLAGTKDFSLLYRVKIGTIIYIVS
jgi:hypothetical protein